MEGACCATDSRGTGLRIAVIIPACNAAATLGDTLHSVLAQTHADWRMVVVDDGSSDATAALAAAVPDPRIQVIRQANAGVSAARNRGMATLNGDGFLFLDADDVLAPQALAALARALAVAPTAVAATGAARFVTSNGRRGWRRTLPAPSGDLLPDLLVRNRFANCGHMLIRGDTVHATEGFRRELSYGEDWEYAIRIAARGHFVAVPGSAPMLFVRERDDGGYWRRAADPAALLPCLDVIFADPLLTARFSPAHLAALRRRAEAENAWVVGRALLRQGNAVVGRGWLSKSVAAAPSVRRVALLCALCSRSLIDGGGFRILSRVHSA